MDDQRVPKILRDSQSDYDRVVRDAPRLYQVGFDISNAAVPTAMVDGVLILVFFEVLRDLVRDYRPDVVITTYPLYQAPLGAVSTLTDWKAPLITVVTDLVTVHRTWFSDAADVCLVPTRIVRDLATKSLSESVRILVTGIPVNPDLIEDERSREEIRRELGWHEDLPTVVVVGSKRVTGLPDVVRALNHSGLKLQLAVIAGGDDKLFAHFQQVEWHAEAHIYNFVQDMPSMLRAADFVICKAGGLIVSEALACGLPMLLVDVVPGQEAGNADYVVANGAGELVEDPLAALEMACHWLDTGGVELAKRKERARLLGRPRAAYVAAELVWSYAEKGYAERRPADPRKRDWLKRWLDEHNVPWSDRPAKV